MQEKLLSILHDVNRNIPDDVQVDLLDNHLIDSFDMVRLVSAIEDGFSIEMDPEDIVPENFRTVHAMLNLLKKYSLKS